MISPDIIARYFSLNQRIIHRQVEGLTHEDSLRQLPFRGNCLNWVLGHIVSNRNVALALLGEEPLWSDQEAARYATGSVPVTRGEDAARFEKLVADLDESQKRLDAALQRVSEADLSDVAGASTLGEQLVGLYWHEAYHTGQTEYLRQLAGKNDQVV